MKLQKFEDELIKLIRKNVLQFQLGTLIYEILQQHLLSTFWNPRTGKIPILLNMLVI